MTNKKRSKIPRISDTRLDRTPPSTAIATKIIDKKFENFVKNKVEVQSFTTRLPVDTYERLRAKAFRKRIKINQIINKLVEDYLEK